jgi:diadenosine tetraphosphate (Ap4A) HIT family hydrolase
VQCLICKKHATQQDSYIHEDQYWIVSHSSFSTQIPGYLYIEPKRHVEDWIDFTFEELSIVGPLIKRIETILRKLLPIERLYVVTISEAVRHIHFHIIPRLEDQPIKGITLIECATQQKMEKPVFTFEEYMALVEVIRRHF